MALIAPSAFMCACPSLGGKDFLIKKLVSRFPFSLNFCCAILPIRAINRRCASYRIRTKDATVVTDLALTTIASIKSHEFAVNALVTVRTIRHRAFVSGLWIRDLLFYKRSNTTVRTEVVMVVSHCCFFLLNWIFFDK